MNFRLTAALFVGVLVLVAGLFLATLSDGGRGSSGGLVAPLAAAGLKEKDVDAVELVRLMDAAEDKLVFAKVGDGKWQVREPVTARADGFEVDAVVRGLFAAGPTTYPALTNNLQANGLAPPTLTATLRAGDKAAVVNVGNTTVGGDKAVTFVTTGDRPRSVVPVRRADLAALFKDAARGQDGPAGPMAKWLTDYRSRRPLGADTRDPVADLKAVKLSAGGKDLALARGTDGDWSFTAPPGFGKADLAGASAGGDRFTGVRPLLDAVTALAVSSPDDFIESPGDPAKYGLAAADKDRLRIELTPQSGSPEVLLVGKPVEEAGKPVSPPKVYAKVEGDPAVMKLPGDRVDALRRTVADPADLRNRDLLSESLKDRIDAIDVAAGGATTKLRKVPVAGAGDRKWVLYGGPGDPQEADQAAVARLIADLTRPRAARDVLADPADAAFSAGEQKASVKVWANAAADVKAEPGKLPPEPAVKGAPIELVFGKKEADLVYLRRTLDGKPTDLKVPESMLTAAAAGRLGFLDLKLRRVDPPAATRLRLDRGSGSVVEVAKADGTWSFAEPADRKGRPADPDKVSDLLSRLARLAPGKVTHEGPPPDVLKGLGLDPAAPRLRAVVGTAAKPDDLTYDFGADAGEKGYVYARQTGRDPVFTAPADLADALRSADLRDAALYRLDPAQVTGLKVRGWKGFLGAPLTYEYDKGPGGWAVKASPTGGGQADGAKIGALLTALSAPKAEAFVGPPKPEYGLSADAAADAVELTLTRSNGPPVTLTLGAKVADNDDLVYAVTSVAPNEAATYNPSAVRPYVNAPAGLLAPK